MSNGKIVGAALVSHVPTLVLPEEIRRELNGGVDTTLYAGLHQLKADKLDPLDFDTVVCIDTHWFTTIEHIVASHDRRGGSYTSEELPRGMSGMVYDFPGDRLLAETWAAQADDRDDTWVIACDDHWLPVHYPTINLLPFLQGDEAWISAGVCQTAEPDDFLLFGEMLAAPLRGRRINLEAIAGRKHHGAAETRQAGDLRTALGQLLLGYREAFANRDRSTFVVQPQAEQVDVRRLAHPPEEMIQRLTRGRTKAAIAPFANEQGGSPRNKAVPTKEA